MVEHDAGTARSARAWAGKAGGAQYAARALELPVALLGIYAPPASLSGL